MVQGTSQEKAKQKGAGAVSHPHAKRAEVWPASAGPALRGEGPGGPKEQASVPPPVRPHVTREFAHARSVSGYQDDQNLARA